MIFVGEELTAFGFVRGNMKKALRTLSNTFGPKNDYEISQGLFHQQYA